MGVYGRKIFGRKLVGEIRKAGPNTIRMDLMWVVWAIIQIMAWYLVWVPVVRWVEVVHIWDESWLVEIK